MEETINKNGFDGHNLSWDKVPNAANLDMSGKTWSWRTVQRALHQKDWHKCIACRKGWVTDRLAELRV